MRTRTTIAMTRNAATAAAAALLALWAAAAIASPFGAYSRYDYDYRYAPERLSRERRDGAELDNWIERGNATVTLSPAFERGIRVAAWAAGGNNPENYDYGVASAVYLFEIPYHARRIAVKIRYEGSGWAPEIGRNASIAGRAWIRTPKDDRAENEPLQGDTFLLRSERRSETIEIPAERYVDERGLLELHIVADESNRVDIDYIEVETFNRQPKTNVIRRSVPGYQYRPWNAYGYHSLYGGRFYHPTDYGYFLYWEFPLSDSAYIAIRQRWNGYYDLYYARNYYNRGFHNRTPRSNVSRPVNRWTGHLSSQRERYERGRSSAIRSRDAATVRNALQTHRASPNPSTFIAGGYAPKQRASAPNTPPTAIYDNAKNRGAAAYPRYAPATRSSSSQRYAPSNQSSSSQRYTPQSSSSQRYTPSTRSSSAQRYTPGTSASSQKKDAPSAATKSSSSSSGKSRGAATKAPSSSGKSKSTPSSSASKKEDDDDKKRR